MIQRIPIPKLQPRRSQTAAEPAVVPVVVPVAAPVVESRPKHFLDREGRLYLENPMEPGLYARYESLEAYNSRSRLPVYVRAVPDGEPVHIDLQTLTAMP